MRGFLMAVAVLLAAVSAHAGSGDYAVPSIQAVTSTMTVATVSIATQTATDIVISTAPLYRQACVQNMDPGAFLACSDNVNVSTIVAQGLFGVYLATNTASLPSLPFCFEVVPGSRFFCKSGSVSAASRAVIIRKR